MFRMTEAQAADEAILMLTRRLRRTQPEIFTSLMASLPEGAREALAAADRRADRVRDIEGARNLAYPVIEEPDYDEDDE